MRRLPSAARSVRLSLRLRLEEGGRSLYGAACQGDIEAAVADVPHPECPVALPDIGVEVFFCSQPLEDAMESRHALSARGERGDDVAVRAFEQGGEADAGQGLRRGPAPLLAGAGRVAAGVGREAGDVEGRPDNRRLGGYVEVLAEAGGLALVQGDNGIGRRLSAGVKRGLGVAHRYRRPVAVALEAQEAARGFDGEVGSRAEGVRSALTVGSHRDVNERRVERTQVLVAEAKAGEPARLERLDEDVSAADQVE